MNSPGEQLYGEAEAQYFFRRLFLRSFPGSEDWFAVAWSAATSDVPAFLAPAATAAPTLGASDEDASNDRIMAREFAILVDTFTTKFPIARQALIERLEKSCRRFSLDERSISRRRAQLSAEMENCKDYRAWYSGSGGMFAVEKSLSSDEIESRWLPRRGDYDIFIYGRRVLIKRYGRQEETQLDERVYRFLLLLLRYKDRHLPVETSYLRAWNSQRLPLHGDVKDLTNRFLRRAAADLRSALRGVAEFEIPDKLRDHGYMCCGSFAWCVLVPEPVAADLSVSFD